MIKSKKRLKPRKLRYTFEDCLRSCSGDMVVITWGTLIASGKIKVVGDRVEVFTTLAEVITIRVCAVLSVCLLEGEELRGANHEMAESIADPQAAGFLSGGWEEGE